MRPFQGSRTFTGPLTLFGAVAFFFAVFSCAFSPSGLSAEENPASADAYVSAGIGDARILIPFLADDTASASVCGLVYNGLTKIDKDLNVVGDLALSWDIEEGGRAITFRLRKNVLWHDGEPFTADDVVFTYRAILDPAVGCPYISNFKDIKDIKALDAYTVRFEFEQPYAPALVKLGMGIIPEHVFELDRDIRRSKYARAPIGTGPYRFSKWEIGQYMVLEANPDYFEHVPGIKRYVYRLIPDQSVQFLELLSDGIDSMDLNPYQFRFRAGTAEFRSRIAKYEYLSHSYTYIGYNLNDPLFSDVRVRRALSYAINIKEVIDAALLGLGEPCTGPFLKGSPFYDDSVRGYDFDPEKAASLLREAGWADTDGDGVLEKDGEEFRFIIATNQGSQAREDAATIVQRQWARVGVKAEIQVIAWSAFLDQFIDKKNFQAVILGWTLPVDPDPDPVWHSEAMRPGGLNFVSYSNKRVDELIEEGRRQFDPEKRKKIYNEIHLLISEDAPYTFLFFPYATPAINKRFHGIEPAPAGIGYNFIDWYVDPKEVRYKF